MSKAAIGSHRCPTAIERVVQHKEGDEVKLVAGFNCLGWCCRT
jgi:hypothetical protein